jgi:hypothetical protein
MAAGDPHGVGRSLELPEVRAARKRVAAHAQLDELMYAVGRRLADLTGANSAS